MALGASQYTIAPNRALTTADTEITITSLDGFTAVLPIQVVAYGTPCNDCGEIECVCQFWLYISAVNVSGRRIELRNPTGNAISGRGLFLTNSEDDLLMWQMPAVIVRANETVRVVSDNGNSSAVLKRMQTNFNFRVGDTLYLSNANGEILSTFEV
jgi:hypothetical protein